MSWGSTMIDINMMRAC